MLLLFIYFVGLYLDFFCLDSLEMILKNNSTFFLFSCLNSDVVLGSVIVWFSIFGVSIRLEGPL